MRAVLVYRECPKCGARLSLRRQRATGNAFLGCTKYPACKFTENVDVTMQDMASRMAGLEDEVKQLRIDVQQMKRGGNASSPPRATDVSRLLRDLIFRFHPDRNPAGLDAGAVVAELNLLRGKVS
jgi:ssDNA-binding Zn-finger/Zn-ribbon topoisomerase 1